MRRSFPLGGPDPVFLCEECQYFQETAPRHDGACHRKPPKASQPRPSVRRRDMACSKFSLRTGEIEK